jgi:hypothetical protein
LLFALGDCLATALGQPENYWIGDYDVANEGNPVVLWCMTLHPGGFFALTVVWIAAFCFAILKLPRVLALILSLSVAFSHAHCTGTWLFHHPHGFYYTLSLCIGCAVVFVLALELSREDAPRSGL